MQRPVFPHRHLLGIEGLSRLDMIALLDLADEAVEVNRQVEKKKATLRGRTQINLFFEPSTRTQASFELAGKRLGADVMNMSVASSSVKKGETLIDTAATPQRHAARHHHRAPPRGRRRAPAGPEGRLLGGERGRRSARAPDQALLDALTDPPQQGPHRGLTVAICGDILHSRVARSNMILLAALGARVRSSRRQPAAARHRGARLRGLHRMAPRASGRRHRHDAAPPARAHERLRRARR
jgi:aspartate carbamoyltransferase catalytic subunit